MPSYILSRTSKDDDMAQHGELWKRGKALKLAKEFSTRVKAKTVKIVGRYSVRLFPEGNGRSGSEIKPLKRRRDVAD